MREIWKDVPGYEGKYQVSNLGRVKSVVWKGIVKETFFTPWINRCGYPMVSLRKNGAKKGYSVHTIEYAAFYGPIPKGMQVNHKDENKMNNTLDNLELVTAKDNCNYGTRNERIGNKVVQLDENNSLVNIFKTANDAERELKILATSIISCCRNRKVKRAGGYKWKYLKDLHPFVLRLLKDEYLLRPY